MVQSEIINEIINNNQKYIKKDLKKIYDPLLRAQTPQITLVTCSDSRVSIVGSFTKETLNKVFIVRNIGNQIKTSEGSVDFGVLKLKTPLLVIRGHTGCSAIEKGLKDFQEEPHGIRKELSILREGIRIIEDEMGLDNADIGYDKFTEMNVYYQVKYATEKYRELIDREELTIIGIMIDLNQCYQGSTCEEYITCINGITDIEKMKKMKVLSDIAPELVDKVVKTII